MHWLLSLCSGVRLLVFPGVSRMRRQLLLLGWVSAMEPHIAPESVFLAPLTRLLTLIGFWASWPPPGSKHGHNPHIDVFVVMRYE
jgi:hypothetical protein